MKKRILLIGNTHGLPGVPVDLANYRKFFKSQYGGGWMDFEIETETNPSVTKLALTVSKIVALKLDYAIVVFSGHGGQERETILEINGNGDTVPESLLKGIAERQLNIFDCCRAFSEPVIEIKLNERFTKSFAATTNTREQYELRIMQAIPQQVSLYACSIGEVSYDSPNGGVYSKHLLSVSAQVDSSYKLVGNAHEEATVLTKREKPTQNPDGILPRCLSSQQLIIGIKPTINVL